jgi:drug/metabolite transporter (DMT)-like permease
MPYVWFLFISLVWGSSFILMKKGVLWFSPSAVGAIRLVTGAAVLAIFCWKYRKTWTVRRQDLPAFAFVVAFGFAWPFCVQPYLVARNGGAFVGMLVSFTPLFTIAASIPVLGIYPAPRQVVGVVGALGCMLVLMQEMLDHQVGIFDILLALTVPLCYACTNALIRKKLAHVPSLELSFVSLTFAAVVLLPVALGLGFVPATSIMDDRGLAIASVVFLGIVGTGISTYIFNKLIQEQGPLFAGMVTNLVPIGALIWGWTDGEQVTARQIAALAGLVSMVTLVQFGAARAHQPSIPEIVPPE